MESLKIEKFHGVGPATAARMKSYGILTGADLKALTLPELEQRFGRSARYYYDLCRGIDHRPVQPNRERKSVGAEDTFAVDIQSIDEARRHLAPLIDKVWGVMTRRELAGRTVTLKIKFANFTQITRTRSRPLSAEFEDLVEVLLGTEFPLALPVRLLGDQPAKANAQKLLATGEPSIHGPREVPPKTSERAALRWVKVIT